MDQHRTLTYDCVTEIADYTLNVNHTITALPPTSLPSQQGQGETITTDICLPVFQLCQDDIAEDDEDFTISFSSPDSDVTLLQNNFTVTIIDDDSKKRRKILILC